MTPTVSVMMAAYNASRYVEEAVASVLGQTLPDFELLVLDDGSTDGTGDLVAKMAAKDDRIRLARQPNAGIVATRNALLRMARGEFVATLDSDDVALPRRLELGVDYLRRNPDCLVVGGDVEVIDPDGASLCVWKLRRSHDEIDSALMEGRGMVLCHSATTMRRADLLEVGGYRQPPGTRVPSEDLDLWLRFSERGGLTNLPEVVVRYRVHPSNASHAGVVDQAQSASAAVEDARARRGLEASPVAIPVVKHSTPAQEYERWAWWALGSGHSATARKHARACLARTPFSPASWKLLLCAIRGQ